MSQSLELVIHARALAVDMVGGAADLPGEPGNIEDHAAVRAASAGLDFAHDATGDMIAREEFGRASRIFVALAITPTLFFVVGGLGTVRLRDITEHKAFTFAV